MDEAEVGRAALADHAGLGLAKELAAAPRRRAKRLPRLETRRPRGTRPPRRAGSRRVEPPPKSVPVAIATPAAWAQANALLGRAWRSSVRARRAGPANRSIAVVAPKLDPGPEDRERRDERRPLRGHRPRKVGVELHAVLDRVDAGRHAHPGAGKVAPNGPSPSRRGRAPSTTRAHLVGGPRGDTGVRAVEIQLEQVGAVVELAKREREELVGVIAPRRDRSPGHRPRAVQPRARGANVRVARIDRATDRGRRGSRPARRPSTGSSTRGAPTSRAQRTPGCVMQPAVVLGDLEQPLGRVVDPVDPVRAAGQREVAVAIDHARHDRRATRIDRPSRQPDPPGHSPSSSLGRIQAIAPSIDEDADADLQAVRSTVCHRSISIQNGRHALMVRGGGCRSAEVRVPR